jgi:hypothetical protein
MVFSVRAIGETAGDSYSSIPSAISESSRTYLVYKKQKPLASDIQSGFRDIMG